MHIYGGMQFRTLFIRILGRSTKRMKGPKGYINIGFLIWKKSFHYLSMSQLTSFFLIPIKVSLLLDFSRIGSFNNNKYA